MKRTLALVLFSVTMMTGCYTSICPTYTVEPIKSKEIKAEKPADSIENTLEKAS